MLSAPARADDRSWRQATGGEATQYAHRHFVEFRSRPSYVFGHTYIVYGRLADRGNRRALNYAGIYPTAGRTGLALGSVVPVSASIRAVAGDYSQTPHNAFRVRLTSGQYGHLRRVVSRLRSQDRQWHLLFMNCNDFAIKVARELGLQTPASLLLPKLFIVQLQALNASASSPR